MKKILVLLMIISLFGCADLNKEKESCKDILSYISKGDKLNQGDSFLCGMYEQDGDKTTKENIEWIVLDSDENGLLAISKFGLDNIKYIEKEFWINEIFMDSFSADEKEYISEIKILNYLEAEEYFENNDKRICEATKYAIKNGVHVYEADNKCWWWLETDDLANGPHNVRTDGHIRFVDVDVIDGGYAIRPTISISYTKVKEENKKEKEKQIIKVTEINDTKIEAINNTEETTKEESQYYEIYESILDGMNLWYRIGENDWVKGRYGVDSNIIDNKIFVDENTLLFHSIYGDMVFYAVDGDTMFIEGTDNDGIGMIMSFPNHFKKDIKNLVIGNEINNVGEYTFAYWNIEELVCHTEIGNKAFENCKSLKKINFNGWVYFAKDAFNGCEIENVCYKNNDYSWDEFISMCNIVDRFGEDYYSIDR